MQFYDLRDVAGSVTQCAELHNRSFACPGRLLLKNGVVTDRGGAMHSHILGGELLAATDAAAADGRVLGRHPASDLQPAG